MSNIFNMSNIWHINGWELSEINDRYQKTGLIRWLSSENTEQDKLKRK